MVFCQTSAVVARCTASSSTALRSAGTFLPVSTPRQLARSASTPCSRTDGMPRNGRFDDTPMARSLPLDEALAEFAEARDSRHGLAGGERLHHLGAAGVGLIGQVGGVAGHAGQHAGVHVVHAPRRAAGDHGLGRIGAQLGDQVLRRLDGRVGLDRHHLIVAGESRDGSDLGHGDGRLLQRHRADHDHAAHQQRIGIGIGFFDVLGQARWCRPCRQCFRTPPRPPRPRPAAPRRARGRSGPSRRLHWPE